MIASKLLLRSLFKINVFNFFKQRPVLKVAATTVGLGLTTWFTSIKLSSQEFQVIQTEDNLKEGEVRQVLVGPKPEDTILVINYQGTIYSLQSKCSHFGFNLAKGSLIGDKIICPLHNAGFSIKTGQEEAGPVFNGLKTFHVERVDGKIRVNVPKNGWSSAPEYKELGVQNIEKDKKIVIIGAGPAGYSAAETLRRSGYKGYIYLLTKQAELPYDRTLLSKYLDHTKPPGAIRNKQSLQNNGIIVVQQSNVTGIDYDGKKVEIQGKESLAYDKLLIASGAKNRVPQIKGLNQVSFYSLRNKKDYLDINTAIRAPGVKNITIIGGGFIGLQMASSIKMAFKDMNVSVVAPEKTPLQNVFGEKVASVLQNLAQKNGVKFFTNAKIREVEGEGNVQAVALEGSQIPTDLLIVATGVESAIDFAKGLQTQAGGIKTNLFLQTNVKDVYAAGDVATYPYWYTGEPTRIEHYNEAIYQGSVAGLNMMGKKFPLDNIPFFWTRQFNNSLVFTGVNKGWDDVHIVGNLAQMKFVAYYIRKADDKVIGAAAMNSLNSIQVVNQAMKNGVMPSASTIKNPGFVLQDLLKQIKKKDPKCARCTMCQ